MLRAMLPNKHIFAFVLLTAFAAANPAIAAERTAAPTFGDLDVLQRELVENADAVRASEEELERLDTRLAVLGEEQIAIRSRSRHSAHRWPRYWRQCNAWGASRRPV